MWIELSEYNYKLLLPLIYPLFHRLERLCRDIVIKEGKDKGIFLTFRYFLSYCLCFFPYIIIKIRSKNITKPIIVNNKNCAFDIENEITKLDNKVKRKKKVENILVLLAICIIGLFSYFQPYLISTKPFTFARRSLSPLFNNLVFIILSRLILKQKLYRHSFLSAGIIAGIYIILFILTIPYMEVSSVFYSFLYYIFTSLLYGSYDVLGKKCMSKYYATPYFLMLSVGTIITVSLLVYDIIAYFVNPDASGIIIGFKDNIDSVGAFFLFILDIFLEWGWSTGIWLVIYYLTPCHYFISGLISDYIFYLEIALKSRTEIEFYCTRNIIIFSISNGIIFFWCLIFNEVFILNVCGLDFNTNKKIKEREKQIIKKEHHLLTEIMKKEGDIVELTDSENDDKTESSLIS
jgi:hypothetical protein